MILGAHKRKEHRAKFVCPVLLAKGELTAILFVDDTDVINFDMEKNEIALEAHAKLQESVLRDLASPNPYFSDSLRTPVSEEQNNVIELNTVMKLPMEIKPSMTDLEMKLLSTLSRGMMIFARTS